MTISIIIPTYNEADNISKLITYLKQHTHAEIIVSDGGSTDATLHKAAAAGVVATISPQKGRAAQMNYGASLAKGDIFYFVHADTFPPPGFINDIELAVKNGYSCGRYQTKFNNKKFILKIFAWFTRFNWFVCYGGDQTFFITKELFNQLGGYKAEMIIMEEYELTARAVQQSRYKIFNNAAVISARKYEGRPWWKVQWANHKAVSMYKRGASPHDIASTYKKALS